MPSSLLFNMSGNWGAHQTAGSARNTSEKEGKKKDLGQIPNSVKWGSTLKKRKKREFVILKKGARWVQEDFYRGPS